MEPRHYLRTEGGTVLVVALATYFSLDGSLWMIALLALAPDLSMLGYIRGPRLGSLTYNVFHIYTFPLLLGTLGFFAGTKTLILVALVWTAHIGADRAVGYGLKHESGFKNTHLSSQPKPPVLDSFIGE